MEEAIKVSTDEVSEISTHTPTSPSIEATTPAQETAITTSFAESKPTFNLFEEALEKSETYQSGFWNGYFELSKDSAEAYLSQKTILNNTKEELQLQEQSYKEIEQQIESNKNRYDELFSQLTQINYQLDYQINLKKRRENDLSETTQQIERYKAENEDLRNKHSFLGGLLFLAAAIVFILGDLIISHEIVAYALNIKNTIEAWSFAVGLAMVSVLLKPAYDRLIEYPYSQDKTLRSKRVYLIFKILIVIFTILTLCILGYFRYEAYRADQLKNNINSNILALQEDENPETLKLLEQLSRKSESLSQDLVNSSSGMWAFVLSGVMFAIAGAICLGIAFPILVAYVRIWFQIPMRIKLLEKTRSEQIKTIEEIEFLISQQSATAEAQKNQINNLGSLEVLKNTKAQIERRILELRQKIHKTEAEMQISELTMGYEKGKKAFEKEKEKQEQDLQALNVSPNKADALPLHTQVHTIGLNGSEKNISSDTKAALMEEAEMPDGSTNSDIEYSTDTENNTTEISEVIENLSIPKPENNTNAPKTITNNVLSKIKKK